MIYIRLNTCFVYASPAVPRKQGAEDKIKEVYNNGKKR
jgi:hypothetical protein